ncbi:dephospho-CoA kinase [Methylotenera sp.]|uniref:dephospho-CoA kinase n=1 Tax=Methylotenera sp. TaxID=2051956 RepID=UPI0027303E58|nr:dephospho-CoA kinase [Methylotenera sp.]MDP2070031.1 dephospho-CoA kinase [Methylotenera sp.]MDP3006516.1 dephospho-CoA kinase [Methylotenera sp.]
MFVIALTGGIGSGKSEAARQFSTLGIPVIDTDLIAHELTAVGEPILEDIKRIFGADFFNTDGSLSRAKLRKHVFNNPVERLKLESLIHPAIHEHALKQLAENESALKPPYQILVIPLLFENNRYDDVIDKILVIDCDESLQIKRAMSRSRMTESEVKEMMAAQVTRSVRVNSADEVILNNGSLAELQDNVTAVHKKFIKTCIVKQ